MKIEPVRIKVSEVYEGYFNDDEEGVVGYDERLNIRPKYQREFVYKDAQRDEVIRTVMSGFPLNVFYWSKNGDDSFEMLDGQRNRKTVHSILLHSDQLPLTLTSFISVSCSVVTDSTTHGLQPTRFLHPWDFPGSDAGVVCHFLLPGIFPTQGSKPGLLHWRQKLYYLSHQ